jgi:hypothetical protein
VDIRIRLAELKSTLEEAGVVVRRKDRVWHQRLADLALRALTFGGQSQYVSHYATTIGSTIYVPPDWEEWSPVEQWELLRHEAVHIAQFDRYGFVPMAIAYLFLPLPVGLAWCRMKLEREAYEETMRARFELEGAPGLITLRKVILQRFSSADYAWMWPFEADNERWFDRTAAAVISGRGSRPSGIWARYRPEHP